MVPPGVEKPVSEPSAPRQRWQGTMIGAGLAPMMRPIALAAPGRPVRAANWP